REALGDPGAQLERSLDDEHVALEAERPEGREPEVVRVRRDRLAQLVLDGAPDVLGVLGHGRGSRLLGRQLRRQMGEEAALRATGGGDYSNGQRPQTRAWRGPPGARRKSRTKPPAAMHTPVHEVSKGVSTTSAR